MWRETDIAQVWPVQETNRLMILVRFHSKSLTVLAKDTNDCIIKSKISHRMRTPCYIIFRSIQIKVSKVQPIDSLF